MMFGRRSAVIAVICLISLGHNLAAQEETESENVFEEVGLEVVKVDTLEELLGIVRERRVVENELHAQRERDFQNQRNNQERLLREAQQELRNQERLSEQLETEFENNEVKIGDLQELLDKRLGSLRELFGVLSGVAGDARGNFAASIINSQYPDRGQFLGDLAAKMGTATELASIEEMEELWYLLQQNMTESGNVARYDATVNVIATGEQVTDSVVRVGEFNLVDHDGYVIFDTTIGKLSELARQPSGEFHNTAVELFEAPAGEVVGFAIDPTKGSLLSLEVQRATLGEMVGTPFNGIATGKCWLPFCDGQGGIVGSIIIIVGILGVALSIERLITLSLIARKVNTQKQNPGEPSDKNPLGRVIGVFHNNREVDIETLQLKMGEAVLQEMPAITRNIALIQVISVVAPLMGLLGTVIGMILTFQAITLFGTGDPKTMAGGISTALMTTVLGLCVAIPTVLLHSLVHQRSRAVIHVLDEQSEGIIAQHAEESGVAIGSDQSE